jgi:thioredoxin-like negative regulator of GroEL
VIKKLFQRRVPQLTGLYIAASWGFVQFVDWSVDEYALSPFLTTFVVTGLLLLLPMVVILVWRHGAPGEDAWTKTDAAVVGINLIAVGGILMIAFSGQELGAATSVRLLEDDLGNTVERVIPKAAFRRDVLLYPFDNVSGDPDLDWLRISPVAFDLEQDMFVTVVTFEDPRVTEPIREAGFERNATLPLSLKRQVAEQRNVGHFLEGEVRREADTLVIETRLYQTRTARPAGTHVYRGTDPLEMTDRMSVDLRRDLGIPEWQIREALDLPLAEILASTEAFRAINEGQELIRSNDLEGARAKYAEAASLDSTSAIAHYGVGGISLDLGDQQAARESFEVASRYAYRLPERLQLYFRLRRHWVIEQDLEAAARTGRYWTELYAHDIQAKHMLASIYTQMGDADGRIAQNRAILAIDSTDVDAMRGLAFGFRAKQQYDSTLFYFQRLRDRRPNEVQGYLDVASTLRSRWDYAEEREEFERAQVAAPDELELLNWLARLDIREGLYEDAAQRVEELRARARTPRERTTAAGLEEWFFYSRGQFGRLEDAYRRRLTANLEISNALRVVYVMGRSETIYAAADGGREAFALAQVDSLKGSVDPPWNQSIERYAVQIHLDTGDIEAAQASLAGMREWERARGPTPARTSHAAWAEGRIAELEDRDCVRALASYEEALEILPLTELYLLWRASCLRKLERWEDAEAEVTRLLEPNPGNAQYRLEAARLFGAQGRTAEAIAELEVALDIWSEADPEFRPAQEARARMDDLQKGL